VVGKTLGHYEILEPLGKGGMGEVYLGEDTRLGRKVAIKVLPAEFRSDPERLARFDEEAIARNPAPTRNRSAFGACADSVEDVGTKNGSLGGQLSSSDYK